MFKLCFIYINLAIILTGCGKSTALYKPVIPANLMQPCPNLNQLDQGTGKEILLWAVDIVAKYNECSALNNAKIKSFS